MAVSIDQLQADWHIVESMDAFITFFGFKRIAFAAGRKGYAARGVGIAAPYIKIVMRTDNGGIGGWWIHEDVARDTLIVLRPTAAQAYANQLWTSFNYWFCREADRLSDASDKIKRRRR